MHCAHKQTIFSVFAFRQEKIMLFQVHFPEKSLSEESSVEKK